MPEEGFKRTELEGGIRVLTEKVPGVRSVSLGVWIDTGSRDEGRGDRGVSHFVEHLLFKGTARFDARRIAETFDRIGADINAATGKEHTSVYTRVLDQYLPTAVDVILDMVQFPRFDTSDIDSERNVVLEEINMHLDSPDELVHDHLSEAMWGDHPIAHMVLGDTGTVMSVDRDALGRFHAERYVANRMVVGGAGAVDHEQLCSLFEELAGKMKAGEPSDRKDAPVDHPGAVSVFSKQTEQAHICLGSRGLPRNHEDRFALAVMDNLLGGSMSSRLFQRIRESKGLAYSIYSYSGLFLGTGMVGIYCGTHPRTAQEVIGLIEEELEGVRRKGFSADERERACNHIKGALYISMEESGNRMNRIAKTELASGEQLSADDMVERVEAVTHEDLERVFARTWGSGVPDLAIVAPFDRSDAPSLTGKFSPGGA